MPATCRTWQTSWGADVRQPHAGSAERAPHGGEALHPLPDRARIPTPPGDRRHVEPPDAGRRPPLPDRSEPMAADIEDEDADPVVDTGPGIDDDTGQPGVVQQPA